MGSIIAQILYDILYRRVLFEINVKIAPRSDHSYILSQNILYIENYVIGVRIM